MDTALLAALLSPATAESVFVDQTRFIEILGNANRHCTVRPPCG